MTSKKISKKTKATDSPLRAATRHASESLASGGPSKKTKPSKPAKKTKPTAVRIDELLTPQPAQPRPVDHNLIVSPALFDPLVQAIKEATDRLVAVIEASDREVTRAAAKYHRATFPPPKTTTGDQVLIKDAAGRVVDSITMPAREAPADDSRAPVKAFGEDEVMLQAQLSTTTNAPSLDPYADAADAIAGAIGDEVTDQLLSDL